MQVSLIIPVKDESDSLSSLIASIKKQTYPPAEIIIVDGGSTDNTIEIAEKSIAGDLRFKIIKVSQASPGKGRNIGAENAGHQWIAFTDAGILLDIDWLENLVGQVRNNPKLDIVYGNFNPVRSNLFEICATFAYVVPQHEGVIRERFIASSLMKKEVWEKVGGFPDLRAAEDLIFMESVDAQNYLTGYAPTANLHWQLGPNAASTFWKFVLYSKHNALVGRQWDWHYGVAKYYLILSLFIVMIVFHSWWWLTAVFLWLFLRSARRILKHRHEYGISSLFNPAILIGVALVILLIDMATFVGWGQAFMTTENKS